MQPCAVHQPCTACGLAPALHPLQLCISPAAPHQLRGPVQATRKLSCPSVPCGPAHPEEVCQSGHASMYCVHGGQLSAHPHHSSVCLHDPHTSVTPSRLARDEETPDHQRINVARLARQAGGSGRGEDQQAPAARADALADIKSSVQRAAAEGECHAQYTFPAGLLVLLVVMAMVACACLQLSLFTWRFSRQCNVMGYRGPFDRAVMMV